MRLTIANVLKVVVSVALLGYIVAAAGPGRVLVTLGETRSMLVVLGFVLLLTDALVRTLNWFQLARAAGCAVTWRDVASAYFAGGFIGALLPSTLGTDVARSAVAAARTDTPVEVLLATTVLLNVVSLTVLCAVGFVASLAWLGPPGAARVALLASAGLAGGCLIVVAALWRLAPSRGSSPARKSFARSSRLAPPARPAAGPSWGSRLRARADGFIAALALRPQGRALASVALVAALSYALRTLGWLVLLTAAGASVPWALLLALGPLITLGALLPISVLGFGGYQAINVYLLGLWGVPAEQSLAASLIQSALAVLLYAIGCVAYVAGGRSRLTPAGASDRIP